MIMMSLCDIMRISHAIREETIKGEHDQALGLSLLLSGCSGTTNLGLLASHRPSTSAVSVPL